MEEAPTVTINIPTKGHQNHNIDNGDGDDEEGSSSSGLVNKGRNGGGGILRSRSHSVDSRGGSGSGGGGGGQHDPSTDSLRSGSTGAIGFRSNRRRNNKRTSSWFPFGGGSGGNGGDNGGGGTNSGSSTGSGTFSSLFGNICSLRILVVLLFLTMSIYIPMIIFRTTSENELERFQREYDDLASKVINSFEFRMVQQLQALDSIDISMTSYASSTTSTSTFSPTSGTDKNSSSSFMYPQVTMPDFDLGAANTLALASAASIWFVPKVLDGSADADADLRQEYEEYTVANQDWIYTALNRELPNSISNHDHDYDSDESETGSGSGFSPIIVDDNPNDHQRQRYLHHDSYYNKKETLNHKVRRRFGNRNKDHYDQQQQQRRHLSSDIADPFQQRLDGISTQISQFGPQGSNTILVPSPPNSGPYFPIWQNAPAVEDIVNLNLASIKTLRDSLTAIVDSELAVLSTVLEFDVDANDNISFLQEYINALVEYLNQAQNSNDDNLKKQDAVLQGRSEPISMIMYPVFESFDKTTMVGLFAMTVYWHSFFEGILPSNAEGLICVIENSCGQAFTYRINGRSTILEGFGDVHDGSFEDLAKQFEINKSIQTSGSTTVIPINQDFCPYTLTVFPSKELESEFLTYRPTLYTSIVAIAFVLIFAVAITYDCVVQRRLKAVLNTALESRAIISSLFPENVRDRLFIEQQQASSNSNGLGGRNGRNKNKKEALFGEDQHALHPAKLRLKTFLDETPAGGGGGPAAAVSANSSDVAILQSKPIADLFPNCTVLFADIAGFTAWSSEREPAQVFTLLQTIFHYFDNIARKWGVFKVETIGDCYVAVTGLPDPQPDHAVRMAKFARESLRTVSGLTHQLETTLGPDTGDLMMRFGMHSGPVTAGVLRGEKSRFQLFGDTVNLASRMENTGKKGFIQISPTTADLLEEAGKASWLTPREDLVTAKGKGRIQTYWVAQSKREPSAAVLDQVVASGTPTAAANVANTATTASEAGSVVNGKYVNTPNGNNASRHGGGPSLFSMVGTSELSTVETDGAREESVSVARRVLENQNLQQTRKLQRLIDWQTEILARLLRSIVAQRDKKTASKFVPDPAGVIAQRKGDCVLDEVAEVLKLPDFDEKRTKNQINPHNVELSPAVMAQLRDYVLIICSRYKNNPFHNFEHASHVTMSSSKLLSRIVVPEDVNYQKNKKDIASDLHDYTYGITSDPLTQFAAIFCSLIHDVDHQGVSNFQLGTEYPEMAEKYKNRSLAEQNSVDIAWDLLMQPDFRNLQQCIFATEEELQRFRQLVVNLVMATDIFDKQFKDLRNSRWERAFHKKDDEDDKAETATNITSGTDMDANNDDDDNNNKDEEKGKSSSRKKNSRNKKKKEGKVKTMDDDKFDLRSTIVIEHIIQAADVAHTMQHWHVYTKWNERLFQEMYLAYEQGRSPKDPSEGWYKGELWFFDNYVIPLGKKLDECNVFGVASDEGLNYALANRAEWAVKGEEIVQDMVRRYKENPPAAATAPPPTSTDDDDDDDDEDSSDDSNNDEKKENEGNEDNKPSS